MGKKIIVRGADFSENAIEQEMVYTLQNGYATATENLDVDSDPSICLIRVRTSQLYGSYHIKTKQGFVIRAIAQYSNSVDITGPGRYPITNGSTILSGEAYTEYNYQGSNMYSVITFCKTDATAAISSSDDIIDVLEPISQ